MLDGEYAHCTATWQLIETIVQPCHQFYLRFVPLAGAEVPVEALLFPRPGTGW